MPLGRAGHDVVYQKMGKKKYASSNPLKKSHHKMPSGMTMRDSEMKDEHMARGRKMRMRRA